MKSELEVDPRRTDLVERDQKQPVRRPYRKPVAECRGQIKPSLLGSPGGEP